MSTQFNTHGFSDTRLYYDINHPGAVSQKEADQLESSDDGPVANNCAAAAGIPTAP